MFLKPLHSLLSFPDFFSAGSPAGAGSWLLEIQRILFSHLLSAEVLAGTGSWLLEIQRILFHTCSPLCRRRPFTASLSGYSFCSTSPLYMYTIRFLGTQRTPSTACTSAEFAMRRIVIIQRAKCLSVSSAVSDLLKSKRFSGTSPCDEFRRNTVSVK